MRARAPYFFGEKHEKQPFFTQEVKKHFCSPKIEISCFSAFLLSDLYGFISRKKLYVAQNQKHSPSENDETQLVAVSLTSVTFFISPKSQ